MKRGNPEFTGKLLGMKNTLSRWGVSLGLLERLPSLPPRGEPVGGRSQQAGGEKKVRNSFLMMSSKPPDAARSELLSYLSQ